jgi:LCP family protein required for cell wall assembly
MILGTSTRRRLIRASVALTASLSLLVGIGSGLFAVKWVQLRSVEVDQTWVPPTPEGSTLPPPGPCSKHPCNYLVFGSDSREGLTDEELEQFGTDAQIGGENRADTIMLVHTDPALEKAIIVSFPRDLWVEIPGRGWDKINAAFEDGIEGGGAQLLADTVANLTGLRIDHYLYVNLVGFQKIVDTLGGVDMCIPQYLADPETGRIQDPLTALDIAPGCQRLDGRTALAFVRTRHLRCDSIPDFSRIGRQQQFLRAVINQMLEPEQLIRAPGLVTPVVQNMRRDAGFYPGDLIRLVGDLRGISTGAAEFRAVPGVAGWEGSLSVVHMDPSAREIFTAIRRSQPISGVGTQLALTPPSEANVSVAVVDDGSVGKAVGVAEILADAGFDVSAGILGPSEKPAGIDEPAIAFGPDSDAQARVVLSYFPGLKLVETRQELGAEVLVVIPASYVPKEPGGGGGAAATECPEPTA